MALYEFTGASGGAAADLLIKIISLGINFNY
jgi:hypothetical protein